MKIRKILLVSIFLLAILTLGAVSAAEDINLTANDVGDEIVESPMEDVELDNSDMNDGSVLSEDPQLNVELESDVAEVNGYVTVKVTRSSADDFRWNNLIAYMDYYDDNAYSEQEHTIYSDTPQNFELKISVGDAEKGSHTIYVEHKDIHDNLVKTYTFPITVDGFHMEAYVDEDDHIEWGMDVPLHFSMPSAADGTINFTFNGKNYIVRSDDYKREPGYDEDMFDIEEWLEREGSKFNIVIKKEDVKYGVNEIVAHFTPDSKYSPFNEKTANMNLTVLSKIHFTDEDIDYNGEDTVSLLLPSDATGKLFVSIGDSQYTVNHENGNYVFHYPLLDLGDYEIMVKYLGDDYVVDYGQSDEGEIYSNVTNEITMRPYLNITSILWDREKLNVSLVMPSKYNGKVTFYRDSMFEDENKIVLGTATIKNGIATGSFKIGPGGHDIEAYVECNDYNGSSKVKEIKVIYENPKWDLNLYSQNMIMKTENELLLSLKGTPENIKFEDNLILKIDGKEFDQFGVDDLDEWYVYINSTQLNNGKHSFEFIFLGDGYFEPKTESGYFEVGAVSMYIPKEIDVDDWYHIDGYMPLDATGMIYLYINGRKIDEFDFEYAYADDDDEYYSVGFDGFYYDEDISFGLSNISVVKNKGNYQFRVDSTVNVTYRLEPAVSSIVYGGDELSIVALDTDYYDYNLGKVSVKIDGVAYNCVRESDAHYEIFYNVKTPSNLAPGTHVVTISYSGDEVHPPRTVQSTFEVIPTVSYPDTINYGEGISLTMPADAKGNLVVYVDNKLYKKVKASGEVFIPTDDLSFGDHKFDVMYDGDDYYVHTKEPGRVVITKFKVPERMFLKGNDAVSIELPSDTRGELSVEVYENTFKADLVNGKASIPLSMLQSGWNRIWVKLDYTVVDYIDDITGEEETSSDWYDCEFDVYVVKPIVTSGSSVLHSANYKIKIQDINGKAVAKASVDVYFNGKKVATVKTDSKGYAYYKVSQTPKTYTVKLVYGKNSNSFKLKVTHVVSLKAVKVKKSAKKLVLTATLKKVNGKYLKNKKVTFKFNGKKYTAKTNSKGVAKLTLKSKILKKLKVGKKITYQVTYGKDTVKRTAKVKK